MYRSKALSFTYLHSNFYAPSSDTEKVIDRQRRCSQVKRNWFRHIQTVPSSKWLNFLFRKGRKLFWTRRNFEVALSNIMDHNVSILTIQLCFNSPARGVPVKSRFNRTRIVRCFVLVVQRTDVPNTPCTHTGRTTFGTRMCYILAGFWKKEVETRIDFQNMFSLQTSLPFTSLFLNLSITFLPCSML